jgi:hypothetical protein
LWLRPIPHHGELYGARRIFSVAFVKDMRVTQRTHREDTEFHRETSFVFFVSPCLKIQCCVRTHAQHHPARSIPPDVWAPPPPPPHGVWGPPPTKLGRLRPRGLDAEFLKHKDTKNTESCTTNAVFSLWPLCKDMRVTQSSTEKPPLCSLCLCVSKIRCWAYSSQNHPARSISLQAYRLVGLVGLGVTTASFIFPVP